ncbi:MAG: GNAT family N-acetyltransferase [Oscillospiraceae bacterium]|nr:GNAT family N-acetyltransferase [Oscillospiraceae bacterium]
MKTLETARLILRKFAEDDFADVHSYASCVENVVYMPFGPNTEEHTRNYISLAIKQADENPITNYPYAVVYKETRKLIGGGGINFKGEKDQAEVGWLIHRDYWNSGLGSELGRELLRFGFEELGMHRLIARCDAENVASYKVMEKLGMRREGLFIESRPAHKLSDKQYGDELIYAILKREWIA